MSDSRLVMKKLLYLKNSSTLNDSTNETVSAMRRSVRFLLESMNWATHQSINDVATSNRKKMPLDL